MATATQNRNRLLALRLERALGKLILPEDAGWLFRCERALHRWAEQECGIDNGFASVCIERDEETGQPYRITRPHRSNEVIRTKIADKEASTLKRVAEWCKENGLHFYHQTDPRGCSLYLSHEPITDRDYTRGVPVCD